MQTQLEGGGAPVGCSALDVRHCLVVARKDAISVYTRDARGPVFVFPGEFEKRFAESWPWRRMPHNLHTQLRGPAWYQIYSSKSNCSKC